MKVMMMTKRGSIRSVLALDRRDDPGTGPFATGESALVIVRRCRGAADGAAP
jgi:hypothetical protein